MKKVSIVLIVFTTLIFSEVSSFKGPCRQFNSKCFNDVDCCSRVCGGSLFSSRKYCKEPSGIYYSLKNIFSAKISPEVCAYHKPNVSIGNDLNATYTALPLNTVINVFHGSNEATLLVSGHPKNSNDRRFFLSEESAKVLGIDEAEEVLCYVQVPILKNNPCLYKLSFVVPMFILFGVVFNLIHYFK